jgi:eukaryotic-like serine/threonine-protein kinase
VSDERWERLQALFAGASDLPPEERTAFLDGATDDPTLRAQVASFLESAERAGRFDRIAEHLGSLGQATPTPDLQVRLQRGLAERYRIVRELGRGGTAVVFLGEDLKHHRQVALKLLRPELAAVLGPDRFLREIETAARLTHPHILPLHDSGEIDGLFYFVMPYVEGESLRDRLTRESRLPLAEAVRLAREVADAVSHAHAMGVIHRDIKPANILLAAGHALIADFGIARALDAAGGERLTETGVTIGTPAYMSPEQATASNRVGIGSDVYSLGCAVYEMLGGQPPFTGRTPQAVLARHARDPVPPLTTLNPEVPAAVQEVVFRALAKSPADRFATAQAFGDALEQALLARPVVAPPAAPRARHRRVVAAALLTVLLIAAWWYACRVLPRDASPPVESPPARPSAAA